HGEGSGAQRRIPQVAMRFLKPTLIAVTAIGLSFPLVSMTDRKPGAPTAYEAELSRIQKDISDLKDGASSAPSDMEKAARYVHREKPDLGQSRAPRLLGIEIRRYRARRQTLRSSRK